MTSWISDLLSILTGEKFIIAAMIFFTGYFSSYPVFKYKNQFKFLSVLQLIPDYLSKIVKQLLEIKWGFPGLFLFIFCFNICSVYTGFISGFIPILPYIFLFLTGINIGMIAMQDENGIMLILQIFNPVAVFEILALCIGYRLGFDLKVISFDTVVIKEKILLHFEFLPYLVKYSFLFLFLAALLEAPMILSLKKTAK